jgi:hypothetical protein
MRGKKTVSVSDLALFCADKERLIQYKVRPNQDAIAQGNKFHDGEANNKGWLSLFVLIGIGAFIAWLLL